MKAALKTADGRFEIAEVADPQLPHSDWVKARVRMAGICGTDLRHWEKAEAELRCCIMGHELAGEVVEIGAGPIGLSQLMLAKASGADVLIIDTVPQALDLARRLGADRIVHSEQEDPVTAIRAMTGDRSADIVFECAGGESMPDTLPLATRLVRRGGKVVIVGGFGAGETTIPPEWQRVQMSEITLIPSASFAFRELFSEQLTVLDLLTRGELRTQELIAHRFPLHWINEAFESAQDRRRTHAIFVGLEI